MQNKVLCPLSTVLVRVEGEAPPLINYGSAPTRGGAIRVKIKGDLVNKVVYAGSWAGRGALLTGGGG